MIGPGACVARWKPGALDLGERYIGGVWVLKQDNGLDAQITSELNTGMAIDNVRGFGWRFLADDTVNASTGAYISTRLDLARDLLVTWNNGHPTKKRSLSLRPIFGQYTPPYWLNNMPDYYAFDNGDNAGVYVAHPCAAGTSNGINRTRNAAVATGGTIGQPNTYFENFFRAYFRDFLIPWAIDCETNYGITCRFLHSGWYGFEYSELYYGPPVQTTNSGYTSTQWRTAHKRLIEIVSDELPLTHATEFAMSGAGGIVGPSNPAIGELCDEIVLRFGAASDRAYASANGWASSPPNAFDMIFGAPDLQTETDKMNAFEARHVRKELQSISASANRWSVAQDFATGGVVGTIPAIHTLGRLDPRRSGVYPLEVYTHEAATGTWKAEIAPMGLAINADIAAR